MRAIAIVLCGLLLANCGEAKVSHGGDQYAGILPQDLARWTDAEVCRAVTAAPTREVLAEAARRDLGDCAAEHRRCRVNGYLTGTNAYRACRQYLAQLQAIDAGGVLPAAVAGMALLPSTGPVGSGRTITYSFPDGSHLSCTTLRNLISCF